MLETSYEEASSKFRAHCKKWGINIRVRSKVADLRKQCQLILVAVSPCCCRLAFLDLIHSQTQQKMSQKSLS